MRSTLFCALLALAVTLSACRTGGDDPNPPVADAGADQTVAVGDVVVLDGSASSASGGRTLTFAWSFATRPEASAATIEEASSAVVSFTADRPGVYEVELRVDDGERSATDTTTITANLAPAPGAQRLEPGGAVFHPLGALLAAQLETMPSAVDVAIEEVADPEAQVGLPAGVTMVGEAFRFTASTSVAADADHPFLVGLIVPDGIDDVEGLAIGLLETDIIYSSFAPPEDEDGDAPEATWVVLEGIYHEQSNTLLSPMLALEEESWIAAIVRADGYETLFADDEVDDASVWVESAPTFEGRCGPGFADAPETCTAADRAAVAEMLEEAYLGLTALGFTTTPRLMRGTGSLQVRLTLDPFSFSSSWRPGPYLIELRPSSTVNAGGMFSSGSGRIWIAIGQGGVTEGRIRTVRHEYVHATQYGYDPTFRSGEWLPSRWIMEGQAVALERGFDTLTRAGRVVRAVDISLEHSKWDGSDWREGPAAEYQAQDFWLYLANRFGHEDATFLEPFMREGMRASEVDAVLRSGYANAFGGSGADSGLALAYWEWVKNQAFTKEVDMGAARFGETCAFTADSATPTELTFTAGAPPPDQAMSLAPLTSHVYLVELEAEPGKGYRAAMSVGRDSALVRSMFFEVQAAGSSDCFTQVDRFNLSTSIDTESRTYLVIVSNTSYSEEFGHTLAFSEPQSVSITAPAEGASFDEGTSIPFRATADGFTDPVIRWTWRRPADGVFFTFGSTASGETLPYGALCDGDYLVEAAVAEGPGAALVSATVSLSVADLGASQLIPGCEPSVSILAPLQGGTYALGEPLQLRAETSVKGQATYPVEWRLQSVDGELIATGVDASVTLDSLGPATIIAVFGAASDAVSITVQSGDPPAVNIILPSDGSTFAWFDHPEDPTGIEVTFTALGFGGDSLPLPGSAHQWHVRRVFTDDWGAAGEGSSTTVFFPYSGSVVFQGWEVRATVTDPATSLVATDTMTITIQRPPD